MPRKGENVYKRKDGRWEGRYIKCYAINGKAKYGYIYAYSYREVKCKLQNARNENKLVKKVKSSLIRDVSQEWIANKQYNVKASTLIKYKNIIEKHIVPDLGNCQLSLITSQYISDYVSRKLTCGRLNGSGGLSTKTAKDILTVFKTIIRYAKSEGYYIQTNLDSVKIKQEYTETRILSSDEIKQLMSFLKVEINTDKLAIMICLLTGIRIGELCALKWEDIKINQAIIQIKYTMQRIQDFKDVANSKTKIIISSPKSRNSRRDIPIPRNLLYYIELFSVPLDDVYLLTGTHEYIEPRTMQYRFKSLLRQAGIQNVNFHTLRHTFATRCIEIGFDLKSLSEILGHSNVNITLNKYIHSSIDLKRKNMELLDVSLI